MARSDIAIRRDELLKEIASLTHAHFVQFYENEKFLFEGAVNYAAAGLVRGEAVLLVVRSENMARFQSALMGQGLDVATLKSAGQLTILDAEESLKLFMRGEGCDRELLRNTVGGVIASLNRRFLAVRFYSELGNVLWARGQYQSVLDLEALWNELSDTHCFSLMCAYAQSSFTESQQRAYFEEICRLHTHVIPSEQGVVESNLDAQMRSLAKLQHEAYSLQQERTRGEFLKVRLEQALQEAAGDQVLSEKIKRLLGF